MKKKWGIWGVLGVLFLQNAIMSHASFANESEGIAQIDSASSLDHETIVKE